MSNPLEMEGYGETHNSSSNDQRLMFFVDVLGAGGFVARVWKYSWKGTVLIQMFIFSRVYVG